MLDLKELGYEYPIHAYVFGNRMELRDAKNRRIFEPAPFTGGYSGREKMQKIMREIAELFNRAANTPGDSQKLTLVPLNELLKMEDPKPGIQPDPVEEVAPPASVKDEAPRTKRKYVRRSK